MDPVKDTLHGYRSERGLLWPAYDKEWAQAAFNTVGLLMSAVGQCKERNVAIQAGGGCGLWALELSQIFRDVYAFEPDKRNFTALAVNTANADNIVCMQAALGDQPSLVGIRHSEKQNCGRGYVHFGGIVPTVRVDDLRLSEVDLIALTVEGRELSALKGAERTIRSRRPVILFEDKGASARYGVSMGMAAKWLEAAVDYKVVAKANGLMTAVPFEQAPLVDDTFVLMNFSPKRA